MVVKVIFLFCSLLHINGLRIVSVGEKSCKVTTNLGTIDLSPLAGTSSPRFQASDGLKSMTYFWNPCNDFSMGQYGNCQGVEICLQGRGYFANYGKRNESRFTVIGDKLVLRYIHNTYLIVNIALVCNRSTEGVFKLGPDDGTVYNWTLTSKHACYPEQPLTTPSSSSDSNGLHTGSILCIILLVLVVIYLLVGVAYMRIAKKATGSDLCPNKDMWINFCGCVKDGVIFLFTCCRPPTSSIKSSTGSYGAI